jgi:hypothetical protein
VWPLAALGVREGNAWTEMLNLLDAIAYLGGLFFGLCMLGMIIFGTFAIISGIGKDRRAAQDPDNYWESNEYFD